VGIEIKLVYQIFGRKCLSQKREKREVEAAFESKMSRRNEGREHEW